MVEEWRDVEGFNGKYQVSNLGRVRSTRHKSVIRNKILKPGRDTNGYLKVSLGNGDGTFKQATIHRMVATAFIPNPDNLEMVNHKDENPANNCVENLEWCTRSYNQIYSMNLHEERRMVFGNNFRDRKTGEISSPFTKKGVPHSSTRPIMLTPKNGTESLVFGSAAEAGATLGLKGGNILQVCKEMENRKNGISKYRSRKRLSVGGYYCEFAN